MFEWDENLQKTGKNVRLIIDQVIFIFLSAICIIAYFLIIQKCTYNLCNYKVFQNLFRLSR